MASAIPVHKTPETKVVRKKTPVKPEKVEQKPTTPEAGQYYVTEDGTVYRQN